MADRVSPQANFRSNPYQPVGDFLSNVDKFKIIESTLRGMVLLWAVCASGTNSADDAQRASSSPTPTLTPRPRSRCLYPAIGHGEWLANLFPVPRVCLTVPRLEFPVTNTSRPASSAGRFRSRLHRVDIACCFRAVAQGLRGHLQARPQGTSVPPFLLLEDSVLTPCKGQDPDP